MKSNVSLENYMINKNLRFSRDFSQGKFSIKFFKTFVNVQVQNVLSM